MDLRGLLRIIFIHKQRRYKLADICIS